MSGNQDQDQKLWSFQDGKLGVLRAAADESARHVRGLYFKFLLFAFYVAVIVFSTDDEQLLKGTGAKLPLLGVELPLVGFYVVVPWLILIFHAHLLSQFYLLSRKLFDLDQVLGSLPPKLEPIQRGLIFPPLIFSHKIVGSQHPGLIRWVFKLAVIVTILLIPILLLGAVQYKFLPYHGAWITLIHQLVFTFDLLLLWIFWPRLSSRSGHWQAWWPYSWRPHVLGEIWHFVRPGCRHRRWYMRGIWGSTFLLLFGIWTLLVPPGNGIEQLVGYQPWLDGMIHRNLILPERTLMREKPPVELLSAARGKKDTETEAAEAEVWIKDGEALDLRGWDLCDWNQCAEGQCEWELCRRDLRYADFSETDLWDADLRGAKLQYANLRGARLQKADLRGAQLEGADLRKASVYGTRFQDAKLSFADLRSLRSLPVG